MDFKAFRADQRRSRRSPKALCIKGNGVKNGLKKEEQRGSSNTPAQKPHRADEIKVLFDWFGFTFLDEKFSIGAALDLFYNLLDIPYEQWIPGRQNYQGYAHSVNYENINIYWEGAKDQGLHIDITGQGCRWIEIIFQKRQAEAQKLGVQEAPAQKPLNWWQFLTHMAVIRAKWTRVDVAIDDFGKHFTVPYIFGKLLAGEVTSKFKSWSPDGYFSFEGIAKTGMTLYFGSDTSRIQFCMYEKAKQLGIDDLDWTRTEIRFKHERAIEFIQLILGNVTMDKQYDVGVMAAGILKDYLTFRDPNTSKRKTRWPVSPFWDQFLAGVEPQRLTSALPDRSIMRTRTWFKKGVSKAFVMMYSAYRGINDQWLLEDYKEGLKKLKPKDIEIIMEYRRMFETEPNIISLDSAIDIGAKKEAAAETATTVLIDTQ